MAFWGDVDASFAGDAKDFIVDIFVGVGRGDLLSLVVVGILALLVLRFAAAPWVFTLSKQVLIFGGLALGVWFASGQIGARTDNPTLGQALLWGGETVVVVLFLIMLYMFFLRKSREKEAAARSASATKLDITPARSGMRAGSGPLHGQGMKVHFERVPANAQPAGSSAGAARAETGAASGGSSGGDVDHGKLEDVLRKMNVLGATRDQNLLTVMVLILVAEFGVFTSRTIAAPNPQVGMFLFAIFIMAAVVFVKTSYKNYWTGVRHFVFATIFALALSAVMLKFWQVTFCPGSANTDCAAEMQQAITWGDILTPNFYFQSDGLIAAITGVAFSTLLTKGGG